MAQQHIYHRTTLPATHIIVEKATVAHITQAIWDVLSLIEIVLTAMFFLQALGANAGNLVVQFVYAVGKPLLVPFHGMFPALATIGGVVDWSILVAAVGYGFLTTLAVYLVELFDPVQEVREEIIDDDPVI